MAFLSKVPAFQGYLYKFTPKGKRQEKKLVKELEKQYEKPSSTNDSIKLPDRYNQTLPPGEAGVNEENSFSPQDIDRLNNKSNNCGPNVLSIIGSPRDHSIYAISKEKINGLGKLKTEIKSKEFNDDLLLMMIHKGINAPEIWNHAETRKSNTIIKEDIS